MYSFSAAIVPVMDGMPSRNQVRKPGMITIIHMAMAAVTTRVGQAIADPYNARSARGYWTFRVYAPTVVVV